MKNQKAVMYRVQLELSGVLKEIEKLGFKEKLKGPYWLKVEAKSPDDACHKIRDKVEKTLCKKFKLVKEETISDILSKHMRVLKLIQLG